MKKTLFVLFCVTFFLSCQNDETSKDVNASKDMRMSEFLFVDALRTALYYVPEYVATGKAADQLAELSADPVLSNNTYPKKIIIHFNGTQTDEMGINRSGMLVISLTDVKVLKADFSIQFLDYYINGNRLQGIVNCTYGTNGNQPNYLLSLNDTCKFQSANGPASFTGEFFLQRIGGEQTLESKDDIFTMSQSGEGQDKNGTGYTSKSTSDYLVDFSCPYLFMTGKAELTPKSGVVQKIDNGANTCDGIAEVTIESDLPAYISID